MPPQLVEGTVEAVGQAVEALGSIDAFASQMTRRQAVTLQLRIVTDTHERYTVMLRGSRLEGAAPRPGDRIAVPAHWQDGRLEVTWISNLSTQGEVVRAARPSAAGRGLYIFLLLFAVVFIAACFAWVIYGFITSM